MPAPQTITYCFEAIAACVTTCSAMRTAFSYFEAIAACAAASLAIGTRNGLHDT